MKKRQIQIGVIGSAADLGYSEETKALASTLGREIAVAGAVLMYGAEKDCDSLSTLAANNARQHGGLTVGLTYGKGMDVYGESSIVIATGLERGGGREMALCMSCDAVISVGGGSGTLTEMVIAYQARIPVIAIKGTGGWSDKMAGGYFDERKRALVLEAESAKEAVQLAVQQIKGR